MSATTRNYYPESVRNVMDDPNKLPSVHDLRRIVTLSDATDVVASYVMTAIRVLRHHKYGIDEKMTLMHALPVELDEMVWTCVQSTNAPAPLWAYNACGRSISSPVDGEMMKVDAPTSYLSFPMLLMQAQALRNTHMLDAGLMTEEYTEEWTSMVNRQIDVALDHFLSMPATSMYGGPVTTTRILDQWNILSSVVRGTVTPAEVYRSCPRALAHLTFYMLSDSQAPSRVWGDRSVHEINHLLAHIGKRAADDRITRYRARRRGPKTT